MRRGKPKEERKKEENKLGDDKAKTANTPNILMAQSNVLSDVLNSLGQTSA